MPSGRALARAGTVKLELRFHDSEVGSVHTVGDGLQVVFSAAAVRLAGTRNEGYVLNLAMLLTHAVVSGTLADGVGRLSAGTLSVDEVAVSPVPLPLARDGKVALTLNFANGSVLSVTARSVRLGFEGEPRFVESFAC